MKRNEKEIAETRIIIGDIGAGDLAITNEALYDALTGALMNVSTEGVEALGLPAFGAMI